MKVFSYLQHKLARKISMVGNYLVLLSCYIIFAKIEPSLAFYGQPIDQIVRLNIYSINSYYFYVLLFSSTILFQFYVGRKGMFLRILPSFLLLIVSSGEIDVSSLILAPCLIFVSWIVIIGCLKEGYLFSLDKMLLLLSSIIICYIDGTVSIFMTGVFYVALCSTYFVVQVFHQNIQLFLELGFSKSSKYFVQSAMLWSPMIIFIVPGIFLSSYINSAFQEQIYQSGFIAVGASGSRDLNSDINKKLDTDLTKSEEVIRQSIEEAKIKSAGKRDDFPGQALTAFDKLVPEKIPGLEIPSCKFYQVICHIERFIKSRIQSAYIDLRNSQRVSFAESMIKSANKADANVNQLGDLAKYNLNSTILVIRKAAKSSVDGAFMLTGIVGFFSTTFLIFAVLKSFLYVFARVVYNKETSMFITLAVTNVSMPDGIIKVRGTSFSVDPTNDAMEDGKLYYSKNFSVQGPAPSFYIPQPFTSIVRRLITGNYAMNWALIGPHAPLHPSFATTNSTYFAAWKLTAGEHVIFQYSNFVAMSSTVKIKRHISFKLSTLLTGRLLYHYADGPGLLYLRTQGAPIIHPDSLADMPTPLDRIVAFQRDTRFDLVSNLNIVDVFLSGYNLRKQKDDLIIIDAMHTRSKFGGALRFIRNFLLPF